MKTLLFLGNIGTGEIILIALVVLLLWGGKKRNGTELSPQKKTSTLSIKLNMKQNEKC